MWALKGASSASDKLFACPADTFYYDFFLKTNHPFYVSKSFQDQSVSDYSSYFSNAGALTTATNTPGLKGRMIDSVRNPSKSILVVEMHAFFPYSWHQPKPVRDELAGWLTFNDARNVASFVDGHVSYIKFYFDINQGQNEAWHYDPPAGYDHKWSGD